MGRCRKKEIKRLEIIEEKYKDSQLYIKDYKDEIERLNNILNKIKDNWNDKTKDDVYLGMSKETLVKTINRKRDCIAYIKIKRDKLQARIDKAIEYIENNWIEYSDFQYVDNDDELNIDCESIKELLDILKGSDKE